MRSRVLILVVTLSPRRLWMRRFLVTSVILTRPGKASREAARGLSRSPIDQREKTLLNSVREIEADV